MVTKERLAERSHWPLFGPDGYLSVKQLLAVLMFAGAVYFGVRGLDHIAVGVTAFAPMLVMALTGLALIGWVTWSGVQYFVAAKLGVQLPAEVPKDQAATTIEIPDKPISGAR